MSEIDWGSNGGMAQNPPPKTREELLAETPADIREEAERKLLDPGLLDLAVAAVGALGVAGELELIATLFLVGVSRLLPRPLSAIVQGPSSSGKSYLIEKVAQLFPDEAVWRVTDMTANALYYAAPGSLRHKFVVAGERGRRQNDDTAAGTKALREMISSGRLVKSVVVKNMYGEPETRAIEQEGPIAFVESTTATNIFEEDRNRCLMLHTDEQPEQTRKILKLAARKVSGTASGNDVPRLLQVFHTVQRLLEPLEVRITYAARLEARFSSERVEARRAFPQLLTMISALALLHQRQRKTRDGKIIAAFHDYVVARLLLGEPLGRSLGGQLSQSVVRFWEKLREKFGAEEIFQAREVRQRLNINEHTIRDSLNVLEEAGAVSIVEQGRGSRGTKWKLEAGFDPRQSMDVLPELDEVDGGEPLSELPEKTGDSDASQVPF